MLPDDESVIAEAGRRLAGAAPDAQVILFAEGCREASSCCDVGFLVIEPNVSNEAEESVRLQRTLRDLRIAADVIVVSRGYADRWREVRGGLVYAAFKRGRVLAG